METQGKEYGYARVSSAGQNEGRQMAALRERYVPEGNIYVDKQSGEDGESPPKGGSALHTEHRSVGTQL